MKTSIAVVLLLVILALCACASGAKLSGVRDGIGAPEAYTDAKRGMVCYVTPPLLWPLPWGPGASMVCVEDKLSTKKGD